MIYFKARLTRFFLNMISGLEKYFPTIIVIFHMGLVYLTEGAGTKKYNKIIKNINNLNKIIRNLKDIQGDIHSRALKSTLYDFKENLNAIFECIQYSEDLSRKEKKTLRAALSPLFTQLNIIENKENYLNSESFLAKSYYVSFVFVTASTAMYFFGGFFLYIYIDEIGLTDDFSFISGGTNSILLFFIVGIIISCFIFSIPLLIFSSNDYVKEHHNFLKKIFQKLKSILFSLAAICSSYFGYLIITNNFVYSIVSAFIWGGLICFLFFLNRKLNEQKTPKKFLVFSVITIGFWICSLLFAQSIAEYYALNPSTNFRKVFSLVGFSKKELSFYKLSEQYHNREKLSPGELVRLKSIFQPPEKVNFEFEKGSVYLYGQILVDTPTTQVLCATQHDINPPQCKMFLRWDLIDMKGLLPVVSSAQ